MRQLFIALSNQKDDNDRIELLKRAIIIGDLAKEKSRPGLLIKTFYRGTGSVHKIAHTFVICFGEGLILDQFETERQFDFKSIVDCIEDDLSNIDHGTTLPDNMETRMYNLIGAFKELGVYRASKYTYDTCAHTDNTLKKIQNKAN